jgi:hypothetical protein
MSDLAAQHRPNVRLHTDTAPAGRYDPLNGLPLATGAIAALAVLLAVLFSSPDERPTTIAQWSKQEPVSFLTAAIAELAGTSVTAEYGPPYNHGTASIEHAAFVRPQEWLGVSHSIDTANDFVIDPLRTLPNALLQRRIDEYEGAPGFLKADGWNSFERNLLTASVGKDRNVELVEGEYENVNNIMSALLTLAQSGGLESDLLSGRQFSRTDHTAPLLFMDDGGVLERRARAQHLIGTQWAMMNQTGSYPGLAWLWPYAALYRIPPLNGSRNADLLVAMIMAAISVLFICVPFVPGIREIPRRVPLYRLIWREHYRGTRS